VSWGFWGTDPNIKEQCGCGESFMGESRDLLLTDQVLTFVFTQFDDFDFIEFISDTSLFC
jgi:hypothetical protein